MNEAELIEALERQILAAMGECENTVTGQPRPSAKKVWSTLNSALSTAAIRGDTMNQVELIDLLIRTMHFAMDECLVRETGQPRPSLAKVWRSLSSTATNAVITRVCWNV